MAAARAVGGASVVRRVPEATVRPPPRAPRLNVRRPLTVSAVPRPPPCSGDRGFNPACGAWATALEEGCPEVAAGVRGQRGFCFPSEKEGEAGKGGRRGEGRHGRRGSQRGSHVQLDSRPTLTTTDGNQNITEVDALDRRQRLDPAVQYKMNHQRRGVALIFNHEHFFWHLRLPDRRGTLADRNNLKCSLTDLGFESLLFDDLKAEDVLVQCFLNLRSLFRSSKHHLTISASKDDHSNADCFVCVFLSHGENDHIYAYDAIRIETITDMFRGDKCQSLVGKPKIFIIQACRGDKHDDPLLLRIQDSSNESVVNEIEVDAAGVYTLPAGADFIMCYSVAQGYFSHRETVNGFWYIQDLCEALRKHGSSLEFTELLTVVNRKVSHRKVDVCRDINAIGKKQIPCFASMLTKKLYFNPKPK
ncbi:LOW QUALITY PROTEIN: caspase-6 [Ciconia maguari]